MHADAATSPDQRSSSSHERRSSSDAAARARAAEVLNNIAGASGGMRPATQQFQRRSGPCSASTLHSSEFSTSGIGDHEPEVNQPLHGISPGSPRRTSTATLRSLEQAFKLAGGQPQLPDDFPCGPYFSLQMHVDQIKLWASNPDSGDGIFQVREKEFKPEAKKRGAVARLVCNREGHCVSRSGAATSTSTTDRAHPASRRKGSIRCGCKWGVSLEVVKGLDGLQQCVHLRFPI